MIVNKKKTKEIIYSKELKKNDQKKKKKIKRNSQYSYIEDKKVLKRT